MRDSIGNLGRVISNLGTARFFSVMQRFISGTVLIDVMHVAVWQTDMHRSRFVGGFPIHGSEIYDTSIRARIPEPLMSQILDPDGPQLIHFYPGHISDSSEKTKPAYRCIVLMRRLQAHFIICLQRDLARGDFAAAELAQLGELSLALLPLVEQHASMRQAQQSGEPLPLPLPATPDDMPLLAPDNSARTLSQRFRERLAQQDITLSSREEQVCILNLSGYTLPAICEELDLRASTVETYLKRARIKLGLSGRHGLSRWMIE
jgi:LuxR family transcriptional regulator, activator of tox operons